LSSNTPLPKRGADIQRFIRKLGQVSETRIAEIAAAVVAVVEYQQPQD
jgi:hypothetical protein